MPEHDLEVVKVDILEGDDDKAATLYDEEKRSLENAQLREKIEDLSQDRAQRKLYGNRLFWLIVAWLCVVVVILFMHGCSAIQFTLPTAVLTTLIGGATVSVISLFAIVAAYLFPKR